MKKINRQLIKDLSSSSLIEIDESEILSYINFIEDNMQLVSYLNNITNIDLYNPAFQPYACVVENYRHDYASNTLSKITMLNTAPTAQDGHIRIPAVIKK